MIKGIKAVLFLVFLPFLFFAHEFNPAHLLIKETKLEKEEIFKRANLVHKNILHNYSNLSISTIDKFNYRIVSTFASDLVLSYNF